MEHARSVLWAMCLFSVVVVRLGLAAEGVPPNTVTFDNQSGEPALVKLVGPTSKSFWVPTGQKRMAHVAPGKYHILARYGATRRSYRYLRGEPFDVTQTATQYSATSFTLHKVIGGNYATRPITQQEFDKKVAGRAQEVDPVSGIGTILKELARREKGVATATFSVGLDLVMQEKYSDALLHFQQASQAAPDDGLVWVGIAFCDLKLGKPAKAAEAARQATKKEPEFAFAHYLLGLGHGLCKHWRDAKKAFSVAARLDPEDADAHYSVGLASMKIGFDPSVPDQEAGKLFREARDEFAKAASLNPQHARAHFGLGFMHMAPTQRDRDAAEREYKILKELDPVLAAKLKPLVRGR